MFLLNLIAVLCIGYLSVRVAYLLFFHPLSSFPGPFLAKLTSLWRFFSYLQQNQHLVDQRLHTTYGGFVRDGPNSLLISDVPTFKLIYGFQPGLEKGSTSAAATKDRPDEYNVLFSEPSDAKHKAGRKKIVPTSLGPMQVRKYEDQMAEIVRLFAEKLGDDVKARIGPFDIVQSAERLTFDTTLTAFYGKNMGDVAAGYDRLDIIADKKDSFFALCFALVPWLARLTNTPLIKNYLQKPKFDALGNVKGVGAFFAWHGKSVGQAFNDNSSVPPSVMRSLLDVEKDDPRRMTNVAIAAECANSFFAGPGSTAAAVLTTLYELALHPHYQARIAQELRALNASLPPASSHDSSGNLSHAHLSRSPTLQHALKESLRLHPSFASPFERLLVPGAETLLPVGKPLPAGTRVWSNLYVMGRLQSIWGEDAEEWRPERWEEVERAVEKGEKGAKEREWAMNDMWVPFGRGSRMCYGMEIAWRVVEMSVAAILRDWEIECQPGDLRGRNFTEMQYDRLPLTFTPRN